MYSYNSCLLVTIIILYLQLGITMFISHSILCQHNQCTILFVYHPLVANTPTPKTQGHIFGDSAWHGQYLNYTLSIAKNLDVPLAPLNKWIYIYVSQYHGMMASLTISLEGTKGSLHRTTVWMGLSVPFRPLAKTEISTVLQSGSLLWSMALFMLTFLLNSPYCHQFNVYPDAPKNLCVGGPPSCFGQTTLCPCFF